jgi:hypothetical protein
MFRNVVFSGSWGLLFQAKILTVVVVVVVVVAKSRINVQVVVNVVMNAVVVVRRQD